MKIGFNTVGTYYIMKELGLDSVGSRGTSVAAMTTGDRQQQVIH